MSSSTQSDGIPSLSPHDGLPAPEEHLAKGYRGKWAGRLGGLVPPPYRGILLLYIASRLMLTITGVVSRILLEPFCGERYLWHYSRQLWLDIWSVWDSGWYLDIAQYGYNAQFHSLLPKLVGPGQLNYAYFPLYPMLMRGLGWLVGDYPVAGIIISNLFLLVACVYLYKLVKLSDGEEVAGRAVRYMLLFPTAFILSGIFSESTFLALAVMSFYFARKGNWVAVGVTGFFLALSRIIGVLLVLPLLYEYLKARSFKLSAIRPDILLLGLIPLGLGAWMAYNHHLTGDWLAFVHVMKAWGRQRVNPLTVLDEGARSADPCVFFATYFVLAALALTVVFCRRLGLSHCVLTLMLIFVPLSNSLPDLSMMGSMPRYVMAAFPLYILLARLTASARLDWAVAIFLAGMQGFLMVFWSNGFPFIV